MGQRTRDTASHCLGPNYLTVKTLVTFEIPTNPEIFSEAIPAGDFYMDMKLSKVPGAMVASKDYF
jgi:hypothetical protein